MIRKLLDVEGPLIGFLDKIGQLIVLNALWILGCLPVVTIGTSNAALYYAVAKSVRRGQGKAVQEFWRSYRENLVRGILVTLPWLLLGSLLAVYVSFSQSQMRPALSGGALMGLAVLGSTWIYIGPVLSRFRVKYLEIWSLAFVMAVRFVLYTVAILAGTVMLALLLIFILPIPTVLLLPGMWCYLVSFPMEKLLRKYMPKKEENDNTWYYET